MIGDAIKARAGQFCRFIEKPFYKYRSQIRQARRWWRRVYYALFIALIGLGFAIKFVPGFDERVLRAMEWLFSQWYVKDILQVFGALTACGVAILFLWLVAQKITTYKDDLMEEKSDTLKKALRPVASWGDIIARFLTVFIGVIAGLHIAQVIAFSLGYCFIETNGCGISSLTEFVFMSLAAPGALLSVWNMLDGRYNRRAARRQLIVYKMSMLRRILDLIKLVFTAVFAVVVIFGLILLGAVAFDLI